MPSPNEQASPGDQTRSSKPPNPVQISIIVPMLNEADQLSGLCSHLNALKDSACDTYQQSHCDIIVVDGGSHDGSETQMGEAGFTVICSERGRAKQMNAGAARASGELLVFLHADSQLPAQGLMALQNIVSTADDVWGRFDISLQGQSCMLPIISWFMNRRSRLSGIATGDQAMFISRSLFEKVGGFANQPLMEDIELSSRLRKLMPPRCLADKVLSAGRRWDERGAWSTIVLMWRLRWQYWRGVSPEQLAERYR
jgi:rSAM/selenodomain-associated transferase 2